MFFLLAMFSATQSFAAFFSKHTTVKATDGEIVIPINEINDGSAHHYIYKDKGQEVKFFVIKSGDGVIRAAFDACDVCFRSKKGYTQDGEYMVCNNCGRKFHSSRINIVEGGCNPAPLNRIERDDSLVIRVSDVLHGVKFF
jgi:uncharacterized membrane protein